MIMPSAVKVAEMKALICVAVALSLIHVVMAADYVVGNPAGGWDGRTDYKSWAAAQTFAPGDTLTFKYNSFHNVLEVTKDAFEACITTNPISYDNSGSTTIELTMPGRRYFICGGPGHCLAGMKMEVNVVDRPAPTTPSPPPLLPPPGQAKRRSAPASMPLTPAPMAWAPSPRSWSPTPVPAAASPRRVGHKKHRKRQCPPKAAPARFPTVQSVEADFPFAALAPMSPPPPPPPTSGGLAVLRAKWGQVTGALAALMGFMLLAL
ncbi:uclacyanin 1-like [Phragmites australis]|uniref:uclacyanin 1-like n=1 Tax=Phragmites australis TaxID=29695 RepID=UPI002D794C59|nr:uclacyanin 1-like [Phragmites australis]